MTGSKTSFDYSLDNMTSCKKSCQDNNTAEQNSYKPDKPDCKCCNHCKGKPGQRFVFKAKFPDLPWKHNYMSWMPVAPNNQRGWQPKDTEIPLPRLPAQLLSKLSLVFPLIY